MPRVKGQVTDFVRSVDGRVAFANGRGVLHNLEGLGDASSFHEK